MKTESVEKSTSIKDKDLFVKMNFIPMTCQYASLILCFLVVALQINLAFPQSGINYRNTFQLKSPLKCLSCNPPVGNLLIGRKKQLKASSTCGSKNTERYCVVAHSDQRKRCFICDTRDENSYLDSADKNLRIENIVPSYTGNNNFWWKSANGVEDVQIQFDLEAEFHFTHLMVTFRSSRPAAMLLEKSSDFGKTWKVYQYFAYNCTAVFPDIPRGERQKMEDVICEERYSTLAPVRDGQVVFKLLPPHIKIDNPYSKQTLDLLRVTNLRLNFTKLHKLGDDLFENKDHNEQKYWYGISSMVVGGSCSCYGHSSKCIQDSNEPFIPGKVYAKCDCEHNTKGVNCDKCDDLYNDFSWNVSSERDAFNCRRCDCNNHASKCEFNQTVFEQSGRISGGVCKNCLHNTRGKNCELCEEFYYRNSSKLISDPTVCEPCNCNQKGTLDGGLCDNHNNLAFPEKKAGQCHCKLYVEGQKCDRCKPGYWNFSETNPEGCEPCTCNTIGTVSNLGCDQITGKCECKSNVIGHNCDKCKPNYYGIDESVEGCQPCNCDPGGSLSSQCDLKTGKCSCRPNVAGTHCDVPEIDHFAPYLDHNLIEAEDMIGSTQTKKELKEVSNVSERDWTGNGYMFVTENSNLDFQFLNEGLTLPYKLIVRYKLLTERPLKTFIQIENIKKAQYLFDDRIPICNPLTLENYENRNLTLRVNEKLAYTTIPICLGSGDLFKARLSFEPEYPSTHLTGSSALIDSIVLMPVIKNPSIFNDSRTIELYEYNRCDEDQRNVIKRGLNGFCKKILQSLSFYVYNGAKPCDCDRTGSISTMCDPLGGQCKCKPNVVGRRCDKCAAGYFNFGANGCEPCYCHHHGSKNNICDVKSGQCDCIQNTYGKKCDQCQPGYWNYPRCRRCECNGHAELCDSTTGKCHDCDSNTDGENCHLCKKNYFGNPRIENNIPCKSCQCPSTPESGLYHADGCFLDANLVTICNCEPGYAGSRCESCATNYWGNPNVVDRKCVRCDCSGNVNLNEPGACDAETGKCLRCLHNSDGDHCEQCKAGYYGNALLRTCKKCQCDLKGTNKTNPDEICNNVTGQCNCLPGVTGVQCDKCLPNHWDLASGTGCKQCDCDQGGSKGPQCNLYEGQCNCKNGYGGKKCNECQKDFYGDPTKQCYPCDCKYPNSNSTQCNKFDGTCICTPGIAGAKCDECARGFTGNAPDCKPCGECFNNWDLIIGKLKNDTSRLIESVKQINQTGLPGAYKDEFATIESQLREIEKIIAGANITELDVEKVEYMVNQLKERLAEIERKLNEFQEEIGNTTTRMTQANLDLASLQNKVKELEDDMKRLQENATTLVEENVEGAYNLTKEAFYKSQEAKKKVGEALPIIQESERLRKQTLKILEEASLNYNESKLSNDGALSGVKSDIGSLEKQIPVVNALVCDGNSTVDKCESMCGGAGCNKCGGSSCEKGATTIAARALEIGKLAEAKLSSSKDKAQAELNQILDSRSRVDEAYQQAQIAYSKVQSAKNSSDSMSTELKNLLNLIDKFLDESNAKPSAIRNLAEKCLALQMSLSSDEISKLARQINETISSLTDIDNILRETSADLSNANSLKERADAAKEKADRMLSTAKKVSAALEEASNAQSKADQSIGETMGHIDAARTHLGSIDKELETAERGAANSQNQIFKLEERLNELKKRYTQNEFDVGKALSEAQAADLLAREADKNSKQLQAQFEKASLVLKDKEQVSGNVKEQAEGLKLKAMKLAEDANIKFSTLREIDDEFDENEKKLLDYSKAIDELNGRMKDYLNNISRLSEFQRNCNP